MDSDYKKYSLERLEEWMYDAMSAGGASPQEIYDVIKSVVEDNYYTYKHQASQAYELLALLNSGIDNNKYQNYLNKVLNHDKEDSPENCKKSWTSFWEENYYPEEHQQYTEEELNAMCDAAKKQEEQRQMSYNEAIFAGWTMTADGFWIKKTPELKQDKVVKWQLPVEIDGPSGEYFICFPDDLLEAANLKEGDQVNWVDNGDGSFTLSKVTEQLGMDEC